MSSKTDVEERFLLWLCWRWDSQPCLWVPGIALVEILRKPWTVLSCRSQDPKLPSELLLQLCCIRQDPQVYRRLQTEKLKQCQGLTGSIYAWQQCLKGSKKPRRHLPMFLQAWSSGQASEPVFLDLWMMGIACLFCVPGFNGLSM